MFGPLGPYYHCIAKVQSPDAVAQGAGLIIDDQHVVTCTHVVADALSVNREELRHPLDRTLRLSRPWVAESLHGRLEERSLQRRRQESFAARPIEVRPVDADGVRDLTLLQLVGERFDRAYELPRLLSSDDVRNHPVVANGFPFDARTAEAKYVLGGRQPNGWIDAEGREGHGQEVREGFSGAPVWDETLNGVVGILTTADPHRRTATLIPIEHLRDLLEIQTVEIRSGRTRISRREVSRPSLLRYLLDRTCPRLHTWMSTRVRIFPPPPEWRQLNGYLRTLSASMASRIEARTYVPPVAKDVDKSLGSGAGRRSGFLTPIQQVIKEIVGVSRGGDATSAQISAMSRKSRTVRNVVHRLLSAAEPLILLGDPGTGKSLTLQQTALLMAERERHRQYPSICVLVRLGGFHVPGKVTPSSVEDYVQRTAEPSIQPFLWDLEDAGRLILLFDGMDEMSRQRYNEHTEALSDYALRGRGFVQTLFSCRIADFTPKFRHGRLVLLPFGRRQILDYIKRQIRTFPIQIGNRSWTARQLATRLAEGELPMQAHNPFVLWLLCIFLQENQSWPSSRVELLDYYNRLNYERKAQDLEAQGVSLPPLEEVSWLWGRIAYEITRRNRGSSIPRDDLAVVLGGRAEVALTSGKLCGVLQESLDLEVPLVRLAHHRFQEYLTATYLKGLEDGRPSPSAADGQIGAGVATDWLRRLDAPNWQETIVNLVLLDGGKPGIDALEATIRESARRRSELESAREEKKRQGAAQAKLAGAGEKTEKQSAARARSRMAELEAESRDLDREVRSVETRLADRVELASRVLRHSLSSRPDASRGLLATVRRALRQLAEKGHPITQVKMLRAARGLPGVDLFEVARGALASRVDWVRQQAHIVTAEAGGGGEKRSALREELVYSFGSGDLLIRCRDFLRVAKATRQRRLPLAVGAGVVLILLQILAVAGLAVAGYEGTTRAVEAIGSHGEELSGALSWLLSLGAKDETQVEAEDVRRIAGSAAGWLRSRWSIGTLAVVLLAAGGFAASRSPGQASLYLLGSGILCAFVPVLGCALWYGSLNALMLCLLMLVPLVGLLIPLSGLLALALHLGFAGLFVLAAAVWTRSLGGFRWARRAIWDSCFEDWRRFAASYWIAAPMPMLALGLAFFALVTGIGWGFRRLLETAAALFPELAPAVAVPLLVAGLGATLAPLAGLVRGLVGRRGPRAGLRLFVGWLGACAALAAVVLAVWGTVEAALLLAAIALDSLRWLLPAIPTSVLTVAILLAFAAALGPPAVLVRSLVTRGQSRGGVLLAWWLGVAAAAELLLFAAWGIWELALVVWPALQRAAERIAFLPTDVAVGVILFLAAMLLGVLVSGVVGWVSKSSGSALELLKNWSGFCAMVGGVALLGWGFSKLLEWPFLARLVFLVLLVAILGAILWLLGLAARDLRLVWSYRRGARIAGGMSPEEWEQRIRAANPRHQKLLIRLTRPATLGLELDEYVGLVESVEDAVSEEPALSAYLSGLAELQEMQRQQRIA